MPQLSSRPLAAWVRRALSRSLRKRTRPVARLRLISLEERTVPATFVVNTDLDTQAANLNTGQDGSWTISLRSAIQAANSMVGAHTIRLPQGGYRITGASGENAAMSGDLDILQNITIIPDVLGQSASIDSTTWDRVFDVRPGGVLSLSDFILTGDSVQQGGAIYNSGQLSLANVYISGQTTGSAPRGGAIYSTAGATLQMTGGWLQGSVLGLDGLSGDAGIDGVQGEFGAVGTSGTDADPGEAGGNAEGGALYNAGGNVTLIDVLLSGVAQGGRGGSGGKGGDGGATISDANVYGADGARGGNGGKGANGADGGKATGGAIYSSGGSITITGGNSSGTATGGLGGLSGSGGNAGYAGAGTLGYSPQYDSTFGPGTEGGNGGVGGDGALPGLVAGKGGEARGGLLFMTGGSLTINAGSLTGEATGGWGGAGGYGGSGSHGGNGGGGGDGLYEIPGNGTNPGAKEEMAVTAAKVRKVPMAAMAALLRVASFSLTAGSSPSPTQPPPAGSPEATARTAA